MELTLKAARVNKHLTQRDVAQILDVSVDTVGNWERGKTYPDALLLKKLEDLYGVSYDQIIFLPRNNA
jgi:putative transcriptional regulator